jgi:hypothetical protein
MKNTLSFERVFLYPEILSVFVVFFGHFPGVPNVVDVVKMLTHLRAFGPHFFVLLIMTYILFYGLN